MRLYHPKWSSPDISGRVQKDSNRDNVFLSRYVNLRRLQAAACRSVMGDESNSNGGDTDELETTITRELLYALVWEKPMLKVAARFKVSSSYMARVCARMNVPRPPRGYWAKLAVGKAPPQIPLPALSPGDEMTWNRDGKGGTYHRPLPQPPIKARRPKQKPIRDLPTTHPLINHARGHFESGRLSYDGKYLKPAKKLLVDITVTKPALDRALDIANQLFLAFEKYGHKVVVASHGESFRRTETAHNKNLKNRPGYENLWSPMRPTVVYIGTVAFGISIIEMSEDIEVTYIKGDYIPTKDLSERQKALARRSYTWETMRDTPTGRFRVSAYSPYWRAEWTNTWDEKTPGTIEARLPGLVKNLESAAPELTLLVEEGEKQAEIERLEWKEQQERWRIEHEEKERKAAIEKSTSELLEIIARWDEANRISKFFAEIEQGVLDHPKEIRKEIEERLIRARGLIGGLDALEIFSNWKPPISKTPNY